MKYISQLIGIIKLGRPRTWVFSIMAFYIGWALTNNLSYLDLMTGVIIFSFCTGGTNLINAYSDIKEDSINLPKRVKLVNKIGRENVLLYSLAFFIIAFIFSMRFNYQFIIIYIITTFFAIFYSIPPFRFKSNAFFATVIFSGPVFFGLMCGWFSIIKNSFLDIPLLIIFLGYWFLTYGTIKNLPDYYGDKTAGIRNSATIFSTIKKSSYF